MFNPFIFDPYKMARTPGFNPAAPLPGVNAPIAPKPSTPLPNITPSIDGLIGGIARAAEQPINATGATRPRIATDLPVGNPIQPMPLGGERPPMAPIAPRMPRIDEPPINGESSKIDPRVNTQPFNELPVSRESAAVAPSSRPRRAVPISPYGNDRIGRAQADYVANRREPHSRWRWIGDMAAGALKGLSGAAAANPRARARDLLAGAGLGAGAYGLVGKINPDAMSSMMFDQVERPRLEDQMGREDDEMKRILGIQKNQSDYDWRQSQIENQKAQAAARAEQAKTRKEKTAQDIKESQERQKKLERENSMPQRPIPVSPGTVLLDPVTRQPIFTAPERPEHVPARTTIDGYMAEDEAIEGPTVKIGWDSVNDADFQASLKSQLTPRQREHLDGTAQPLKGQLAEDFEKEKAATAATWRTMVEKAAKTATENADKTRINKATRRYQQERGGSAPQRPASTGKTFPASAVSGLAAKWGVDEAEAKRRLSASGYTVQ